MSRTRIAIDMDEVIADTYGGMLSWLVARCGPRWTPEDLHGRQLDEVAEPKAYAELIEEMHAGAFFADLGVIDGAIEALKQLDERYDVFITTAAMEFPGSFGPKFLWLRRNFPFIDPMRFVFCGDKSVIHADFLIDDNVRHFDRFAGQGIVFTSPHNADKTGYPRIDRWGDAVEVIRSLMT